MILLILQKSGHRHGKKYEDFWSGMISKKNNNPETPHSAVKPNGSPKKHGVIKKLPTKKEQFFFDVSNLRWQPHTYHSKTTPLTREISPSALAMALERSQIHLPCRLHGRVIIFDALEMWIWVPQQNSRCYVASLTPLSGKTKHKHFSGVSCHPPKKTRIGRCWMLMSLILALFSPSLKRTHNN